MPRTGKLRQVRRESTAARLTVLRPGPIGDTGAGKRMADAFVDVFPYVSLAGIDPDRDRQPLGDVMGAMDESHIHSRTRGKHARSIAGLVRDKTGNKEKY